MRKFMFMDIEPSPDRFKPLEIKTVLSAEEHEYLHMELRKVFDELSNGHYSTIDTLSSIVSKLGMEKLLNDMRSD